MSVCPLCATPNATLIYTQPRGPLSGREYYHCAHCQLIHVPKQFHLSAAAEKSIYDLHQNNPDDSGYRKFLKRLLVPMLERLPKAAQGLDFGCGPGPALATLFKEAGFSCCNYDIYYEHVPQRLQRSYDFVVCTEVIEHVAQPQQIFDQLLACVKPGGYLGIMTQRWTELAYFKAWQYRNDPTHIVFFHERTFHWLATKFALDITIYPRDVVIFKTPHTFQQGQ